MLGWQLSGGPVSGSVGKYLAGLFAARLHGVADAALRGAGAGGFSGFAWDGGGGGTGSGAGDGEAAAGMVSRLVVSLTHTYSMPVLPGAPLLQAVQ
jgi:hypothetical protein